MNNLDPDVAERPDDLVVYGGSGKAARNWAAFDAIVATLTVARARRDAARPVRQAGRRVPDAPGRAARPHRQRAARAGVGDVGQLPRSRAPRPDDVRPDDGRQLDLHRHQGIVQGTYETLAAVARRHFGGTLAGRLVVTAGLGGMGGAQPLAVDDERRRRAGRRSRSAADRAPPGDALPRRERPTASTKRSTRVDALDARRRRRARSACAATPPTCCRSWSRRGITPDVLTDQTSAHDALERLRARTACRSTRRSRLRERNPRRVHRAVDGGDGRARARDAARCRQRGAVTFDYGNNIRAQARQAGVADAFDIPGLRAGVHPAAVLRRQGTVPLGGAVGRSGRHPRHRRRGARDVRRTTRRSCRWIRLARERVAFQGLPARILLARLRRARALRPARSTSSSATGAVKAPIVIGRDHLDTGSVASPNRETEGMRDGSDAIADWPILNALLNASSGATWVSVHHGGGVGIGYSLHAGMVIVADGTRRRRREARARADLRSRASASCATPTPDIPKRSPRPSAKACESRCVRRRDVDSRAPTLDAPRARGARRVAVAHPGAARRLRQRPHDAAAAAARSARAARRASTSTSSAPRPRRSASCARSRRSSPFPVSRQRRGASRPARAPRSTRRWRSSARARAPAGEPATFLLDEFLELRTFESFPGLRRVLHDLRRRPGGERQPLRADQPLRRARAAPAARSLGAVRSHPHAGARPPRTRSTSSADRRRAGRDDAHDARLPRAHRAGARRRPAGLRARARRRARAMREHGGRAAATRSARWPRCSRPTAASRSSARFCYELRLHRARGYGALKAILEILARGRRR